MTIYRNVLLIKLTIDGFWIITWIKSQYPNNGEGSNIMSVRNLTFSFLVYQLHSLITMHTEILPTPTNYEDEH